ncbi:Hypothetical predicted protein [Cloeon dipterum]|uniref:Synaptogyrin n=1 Tax=Cloeon dipterum TaxID=197152 RepID=A0A8S1BYF9_9INSE|nr:Hypothetical predicted protein [Cloeon dipterum]
MEGGAYGGGKAGGAFDPLQFIQRPQVILRALCLLFAIIVFGCISSQGWRYDNETSKEVCLYNNDSGACNYGTFIGVMAFIGSIVFLVGEFLFEQMSSVKTRKHFVLGDLGFSAFWAFLYFVGFCYLANQWSDAETPEGGYGVSNVQAAITFCFFSVFTWAGCAWFAFQRFKQGTGAAFQGSYEADPNAANQAGYSSYPDAEVGGYNEPPFSGNTQGQMGDYSAPTY